MEGFFAFLTILLASSPLIKVFTVLCLFRIGLGIKGVAFEIVILTLSLVITLLIIDPQVTSSGGINACINTQESLNKLSTALEEFSSKHTDPAVLEKIQNKTTSKNVKQLSFIVSELKSGFTVGVMVMVPFLVTDLLIMNLFVLLGISQLSPLLVSLPLKIILFVLADGWTLLSQKLILGY